MIIQMTYYYHNFHMSHNSEVKNHYLKERKDKIINKQNKIR